jgi:hypothetical protein
VRRCAESLRHGHYVLEQATNAYRIQGENQWRGYQPPPPPPLPGTWGNSAPMATPAGDSGRGRDLPAGTGEVIQIAASGKVAFRAAKELKQAV